MKVWIQNCHTQQYFVIKIKSCLSLLVIFCANNDQIVIGYRGEQNFHIFYYIHDGLSSDDRESLYHLKENITFKYIEEYTQRGSDIASLAVNRIKFKAIQHCFDIIGFKPQVNDSRNCIKFKVIQHCFYIIGFKPQVYNSWTHRWK